MCCVFIYTKDLFIHPATIKVWSWHGHGHDASLGLALLLLLSFYLYFINYGLDSDLALDLDPTLQMSDLFCVQQAAISEIVDFLFHIKVQWDIAW